MHPHRPENTWLVRLRVAFAAAALAFTFHAWGAAAANAATFVDPTNNADLNAVYAGGTIDGWAPSDFGGETTVAAIATLSFYPDATPAQTAADAAWEFSSSETDATLGVAADATGADYAAAVDSWATVAAGTFAFAGEYVNPNGVRVVFVASASGKAINQSTGAVVDSAVSPWAPVSPPPPPPPPTTQEVTLSVGDAQRLDLMWWGVWFSIGMTLAFHVGGRAWRHFKGWS